MTISRSLWAILSLSALVGVGITVPATGLVWEQFTTEDGLISNDVTALFEAIDGSIWIGPWAERSGAPGVNQCVDGAVLTWNSGEWVPIHVTGICQDKMRRIWACSYDMGCGFLDQGLWNQGFYWSATEPPLANGGVKCDSEGRLWAGFLSGVMYYDPGTNQSAKVWAAPPDVVTTPHFLFVDSEDHAWFSVRYASVGFCILRIDREGNELARYPEMWGQVSQSADGTIWLGRADHTDDGSWFGVGRLEGSQFVSVSPPAGSFPAEPWWPICVTSAGEVVTSSFGRDSCGVFIYDGENWRYNEAPFQSRDIAAPIESLISDGNGDVWVGTTNIDSGLWVLRRNQSQSDIEVGLSTNASEYVAGDAMKVLLDVTSAQAQTVDLYVAIQLPAGDVLFYPSLGISWSAFWPGLVIPAGTDVERYELFSLTLPGQPAGTYRWFAACTDAGTMQFASNIASCEWQFTK